MKNCTPIAHFEDYVSSIGSANAILADDFERILAKSQNLPHDGYIAYPDYNTFRNDAITHNYLMGSRQKTGEINAILASDLAYFCYAEILDYFFWLDTLTPCGVKED